VPSVRRVPPDSLTPRAKTHNYLNLVMADLEAHARDPESWAVLLDHHGNLCEGLGSNIFVVRDDELLTPYERFVLPGVSRATVIELAAGLGIPCREADIDLYDAYNADEVFLTSTSLCICPVRSVNGSTIADGAVPGPITRRLTDAYVELVDCDFVAQYLNHLAPPHQALSHQSRNTMIPNEDIRHLALGRKISAPNLIRHKPIAKTTYQALLEKARQPGATIRLLRTPEQRATPGSSKHAQFLYYSDGMLVSDFVGKREGKREWLRRDLEYGHITIEIAKD
jgi:Amino-transferase class IV